MSVKGEHRVKLCVDVSSKGYNYNEIIEQLSQK